MNIFKFAEEFNEDVIDDTQDVIAANAIDLVLLECHDISLASQRMSGISDSFRRDGLSRSAARIDTFVILAADNPHFWVQPERSKNDPVKPPRESLGPLGFSGQTRHSPDLPGVSLVRVEDGVYRDPVTNKIYDFKKGFKLDDGTVYPGGSISSQTTNSLDKSELYPYPIGSK